MSATPPATATLATPPYRPAALEPHWQQAWQDARVFEADPEPNPGSGAAPRPKWFIVELPPFATGQLHMGHARNYVLADAGARYRRMRGHNVLYTSGFDTFGLPTELAAREAGCDPAQLASQCSETMGEQFVRLGLGHDRRRITQYHDPAFYRWVQWVFVRLFNAGHCFRRDAPVAWCAHCEVSLAASLAENGRCWRCNSAVQTRVQAQWFVREADFADAMLDGMDALPGWPDTVKKIHRDWIGRRECLALALPLQGLPQPRGAADAPGMALELLLDDAAQLPDLAFVALGRRHPVAMAALQAGQGRGAREVGEAREVEGQGGDGSVRLSCTALATDAGGQAVALPVVLAPLDDDSVRAGLPGRSPQDLQLAQALGIATGDAAGAGPCDAGQMLANGQARPVVRYRLQDWNIARNRYWGPPVPIVHCPSCGPVAVAEQDLPVLLPADVDLRVPGNPLELHTRFRHVACPRCQAPARRDAETLEAYSSPWWYHWLCKGLDTDSPFSAGDARAWLPVDVMIGGADQVRSCFFHVRMMARALASMGIADVQEPVTTLLVLGMVKQDDRKMSKSAGNAVDLHAMMQRYGADALRLAILGAAAPERDFNWSEMLIRKQQAFLVRVWNFVHAVVQEAGDFLGVDGAGQPAPAAAGPEPAPAEPTPLGRRMQGWLATGVHRIGTNFERHDYHLAVKNFDFLFDRLQTFRTTLHKTAPPRPEDLALLAQATRCVVLCLAPLAPHIAEELWRVLGGRGMAALARWPQPGAAQASATPEALAEAAA